MNQKYPIIHGQRAETRYGPTVILTLEDSDVTLLKICLPKRYGNVTDEDLAINSRTVALDLISKGRCEASNSVVLVTEKCVNLNCRSLNVTSY